MRCEDWRISACTDSEVVNQAALPKAMPKAMPIAAKRQELEQRIQMTKAKLAQAIAAQKKQQEDETAATTDDIIFLQDRLRSALVKQRERLQSQVEEAEAAVDGPQFLDMDEETGRQYFDNMLEGYFVDGGI